MSDDANAQELEKAKTDLKTAEEDRTKQELEKAKADLKKAEEDRKKAEEDRKKAEGKVRALTDAISQTQLLANTARDAANAVTDDLAKANAGGGGEGSGFGALALVLALAQYFVARKVVLPAITQNGPLVGIKPFDSPTELLTLLAFAVALASYLASVRRDLVKTLSSKAGRARKWRIADIVFVTAGEQAIVGLGVLILCKLTTGTVPLFGQYGEQHQGHILIAMFAVVIIYLALLHLVEWIWISMPRKFRA